jgi:ADP-heptose:LPS heptosyltransferase
LSNKIRIKQLVLLLPGLIHCLALYIWLRFIRYRNFARTTGDHKRVLVVKLDAIGDFILWLDVAKELRRVYPQNEYVITLLGNRHWTDLAKTLNYFDEVWAIDRPSFFAQPAKYCELLERLLSVTFDVVLHPVYSREFLFGDLFVWASNARQKIGMQGDCTNLNCWQKRLGDCRYTELISGSGELERELEHNALLLRRLGLPDFKVGVPDLSRSMESFFLNLPQNYYVVVAGASVSFRKWPASNFVALIERIHMLTGMSVVLCGVQSEEKLGKTLEGGTSVPLINLTGRTSILELVSVISGAQFIVGNETGGLHIAAALGVPSVCIMGGGHFGRFMPYSLDIVSKKQLPIPVFQQMECFGCNWECIYSILEDRAAPCVENISLELVYSAVIKLIEHNNCSQHMRIIARVKE